MIIRYGICKMYMHEYAAMIQRHMIKLEERVQSEIYVIEKGSSLYEQLDDNVYDLYRSGGIRLSNQ